MPVGPHAIGVANIPESRDPGKRIEITGRGQTHACECRKQHDPDPDRPTEKSHPTACRLLIRSMVGHWLSRENRGMRVTVERYAGRKADERPVRVRLDEHEYTVEEVLDLWYGPDHVFFKIRGMAAGDMLLQAITDIYERFAL